MTRTTIQSLPVCLAALSLAAVWGSSAVGAEVTVFMLGGQSNMDGRADASGLPVALQTPQADVLFYYRDPAGASLTTLRPGSGTDFGPEITFGRTIADAFPNESFALLKQS